MPASAQFSVDEVNALVPRLEAIFSTIDELEREIGARANELQLLGHGTPGPEVEPEEVRERRRIVAERRRMLEAQFDEIAALGGRLVDLELGIVDFPSSRGGDPVLLSWQRGDAAVRYYHQPDEHFIRGRRPI